MSKLQEDLDPSQHSYQQEERIWDPDEDAAVPRIRDKSQGDAPVGSGLAGLRAKVDKIRDESFLDLEVPGLDGIWVRYLVVEQSEAAAIVERRDKQRRQGKLSLGKMSVIVPADILVRACKGVWTTQEFPDEPPSLDTELPVFGDPDLAEVLEVDPGRALDAVLELYPLEGHITQAADEVARFSGIAPLGGGALGT